MRLRHRILVALWLRTRGGVCCPSVALLLSLLIAFPIAAQDTNGTVTIQVRHGAAPVQGAEVGVAGQTTTLRTDTRGEARLTLPAGQQELNVYHPGFAPVRMQLEVPPGGDVTTVVQLQEQHFEDQVTVVSATRSGTVVQDQPIRVEAVPQEEIEENLTVAPGNVSTLLAELAGVQVQTVAPALGGAGLRLQGLPARYTAVLSDELPVYGQQPDAFSLLQIPPLDLARVEVIKGTASALYGGTALGGVLNLVSLRPGAEPQVLLSRTSRGGTDAVGFGSGKLGPHWGWTALGSVNRQRLRDTDHDGWGELAGYRRGVLRPRLFWDDGSGHNILVTMGGTVEDREGGTLDGSFPVERLTHRFDGGFVGNFLIGHQRLVSVHASDAHSRMRHRYGNVVENERLGSGNVEATLTGTNGGHTWVVGGAAQREAYRARDVAGFDYTYTVPGILVQDEYAVSPKVTVSGSARIDFHDRFGTRLSPRISTLLRPVSRLSVRLSAGAGYRAPVPLTEETLEVGLSRTLPPNGLEPERAKTLSLDVAWPGRRLELNGALFASEVQGELLHRPSAAQPGLFELVNSPLPVRTYGSEILARLVVGRLHVIGTQTFVCSTGADPDTLERRDVPLTPRHSTELAAILESEERGRIGVEVSYTGRQRLGHDPYREQSVPFTEVNVLGELRIRKVRVFANAVDLTNVRQTQFDPLLLPQQAPDGRMTTDVWAPLEGRTFNVGVRFEI